MIEFDSMADAEKYRARVSKDEGFMKLYQEGNAYSSCYLLYERLECYHVNQGLLKRLSHLFCPFSNANKILTDPRQLSKISYLLGDTFKNQEPIHKRLCRGIKHERE